MTEANRTTAQPAAPAPERNRLNMTKKDYEGAPSTLCRGCGHDAITACIMSACYESNIDPAKVVKMSGIGCSAKTPTYFMSQYFGFNGLHGRMAAMATGVGMANRNMLIIGLMIWWSASRRRSLGMNASRGIICSTTGCRPASISSAKPSTTSGRA